ncbi:STAS domain-containing protein [Nonomuraea indica]|uniref:STAS domain-containing protein n=1 Tax=Nonomuraea indica TaxID=1581193 RepID=UPI0015DFE0C0|nr:STAS domain-containing protein [Nonomuraea indica]
MGGDTGMTERLVYADRLVRISLRATEDDPVLMVAGEVDRTNSEALARALERCRPGGGHVTVDTGALTFVDLSGLRVLLLPATPAAQRWIRLRNLTPSQRRIIALLGWCEEPEPGQPLETSAAEVPRPVGPPGRARGGRWWRSRDASS